MSFSIKTFSFKKVTLFLQTMPKFFLIEEKCRFLSNFSSSTAEVDIPGEYLLPKHTNYYVKIARFMPRVQVVQKHNTAARRLFIRGHNGKIYPYLVSEVLSVSNSYSAAGVAFNVAWPSEPNPI